MSHHLRMESYSSVILNNKMKIGSLVFCNELNERLIVVIEKKGKAIVKGRDKKYRVVPTEKLEPIE